MDKGRFLIESHLTTGRSIKEWAAAHQVSESWLFKLLRRYRLEGPARLEPRSRRPKTSPHPHRRPLRGRDRAHPKELAESGFDAGAETIHFHMATPGREAPSVSTIHRVLVARGFVVPEPHKRPKSSWTRIAAEFPNECWQADVTHVEVADGVVYEVLNVIDNVIDDHSRLCVASRAFVTTRSADVVRTLHMAAGTRGYPQRFLTDNGRIFTTPLEAWSAREKMGPIGPRIEAGSYRIRHDKIDRSGWVTLRYKCKLHHIGVGSPYAGWRIILLGLDVRILGIDGSPLRHLTLDPSVDY